MTEWRVILDAPCYQVSEYGDVRRCIAGVGSAVGKVIKPRIGPDGYRTYNLFYDGRRIFRLAHRLVAEAFSGFLEWVRR